MRKYFIFFLCFVVVGASSQTLLTIPRIQGDGNFSPYTGVLVKTSGIVTAKFMGTEQIGGFFMQDPAGDDNPATSDGIFVANTTATVEIGDKITLIGTVAENSGRTQLNLVTEVVIFSRNNLLPGTKVIFNPETFNFEQYEGMLLEFNQELFVTNNRNLYSYGELELWDKRKTSPTNVAFPLTKEYFSQANRNNLTPLYLDDARTTSVYPPLLAISAGIRRMGERVKNLEAVLDYSNNKYMLYPLAFPVNFKGNPRPLKPENLGNYNVKVCGFNLEYYLTQSFGTGFGPKDQAQADKQHTKIIAALQAIDADIYGLAEIEQGQAALSKLTTALNAGAINGAKYNYVSDATSIYGTYTKSGYIYRSDKIAPVNSIRTNNSVGPYYRKQLQGFKLLSNEERFIFSMNHFKAKNCSGAIGDDVDYGDGQGCYNATRIREASSTCNFVLSNESYYGDADALVMGDLNAYAKENPIQTFTDAGYVDMIQQFQPDTAYSYVYAAQAGYLDHALANSTMAKQITGVSVFHINADEHADFEYSGSKYYPDMYRCSDHDPVVVGLALGLYSAVKNVNFSKSRIYPTLVTDKVVVEDAENSLMELYSFTGIKLMDVKIGSNAEIVNLKNLGISTGAYILLVKGQDFTDRHIIFIK